MENGERVKLFGQMCMGYIPEREQGNKSLAAIACLMTFFSKHDSHRQQQYGTLKIRVQPEIFCA